MVPTTSDITKSENVCVIVGASHAGVTCAFEMRKQGFSGRLVLIDADSHLPYHRPPLSKAFLNTPLEDGPAPLKAQSAYDRADIDLLLGVMVTAVNVGDCTLNLTYDGGAEGNTFETLEYTQLVLATGASPIIPAIQGVSEAENCLVMRNANDALALKSLLNTKRDSLSNFHVVVVGAGYIGLEAASSLRKSGVNVTVIEREARILARVASETMSSHVASVHQEHGTNIVCQRNVQAVERDSEQGTQWIVCDNGERYRADAILLGIGVRVNNELANQASLACFKGAICVNTHMQTSNKTIWAIGDCTSFTHPEYGNNVHIESVQNALDQAKVAAKNIQQVCMADDKHDVSTLVSYESTPWFWSDQYEMKLQIVGLNGSADNQVIRKESVNALSVWHFKGEKLVSIEVVNSPKSYVAGSKIINNALIIDKGKLANSKQPLTDLL